MKDIKELGEVKTNVLLWDSCDDLRTTENLIGLVVCSNDKLPQGVILDDSIIKKKSLFEVVRNVKDVCVVRELNFNRVFLISLSLQLVYTLKQSRPDSDNFAMRGNLRPKTINSHWKYFPG